jgi:hypothetical protein
VVRSSAASDVYKRQLRQLRRAPVEKLAPQRGQLLSNLNRGQGHGE